MKQLTYCELCEQVELHFRKRKQRASQTIKRDCQSSNMEGKCIISNEAIISSMAELNYNDLGKSQSVTVNVESRLGVHFLIAKCEENDLKKKYDDTARKPVKRELQKLLPVWWEKVLTFPFDSTIFLIKGWQIGLYWNFAIFFTYNYPFGGLWEAPNLTESMWIVVDCHWARRVDTTKGLCRLTRSRLIDKDYHVAEWFCSRSKTGKNNWRILKQIQFKTDTISKNDCQNWRIRRVGGQKLSLRKPTNN